MQTLHLLFSYLNLSETPTPIPVHPLTIAISISSQLLVEQMQPVTYLGSTLVALTYHSRGSLSPLLATCRGSGGISRLCPCSYWERKGRTEELS